MFLRRCTKLFHRFRSNDFTKLIEMEHYNTSKIYNSSVKYVARLMPEIETKLEAEEIKHRKHPGIRKYQCVTLPEWLLESLRKITSHVHYKTVQEDAKKLNTYLYSRRLPIEEEEIDRRTAQILEKMNVNIEDIAKNDKMGKRQMEEVKNRLKTELRRWQPLDYTQPVCLAYLFARLAANYAATSYVFHEIMLSVPSFAPKTYFDFGSGVGSALWAAHAFWNQSLEEYFCVDSSSDMNSLCELLMKGGDEDNSPLLKNMYFRQFLPASNKLKYDVVVSAFSMMDLPSASERIRVIDTLWQKTNDVLVIIENGGTAGFSIVLDARDYILKIEEESSVLHSTGAHIIAPCPHENECPLYKDTKKALCQFSVRYQSPLPKKDANLIRKDVFSYVVLRRGPKSQDSSSWPRIVKPILARSRKVHCKLCCNDGQFREFILTKKRDGKHTYRCARQSSQGDLLPVEIVPLTEQDIEESSEDETETR